LSYSCPSSPSPSFIFLPSFYSTLFTAKYLKSEYDLDKPAPLKKAFKAGVTKGVIIQLGQRFKVVGDAEYEV